MGLQIGADFRDYKSGQRRLQIGAALGLQIGQRLQIVAREITNRGKRDYKSRQGL